MPVSASCFQLPIPSILYLIPPSHPLQWTVRLFFLCYTVCIAISAITALVPLSILLHMYNPRLGILSLHPDNLPPTISPLQAIARGWMVYTIGTFIWSITCVGNAPGVSIETSRFITKAVCWIVERFASLGIKGKLVFGEEVAAPLDDSLRHGALKGGGVIEVPIFTLTHQTSSGCSTPPASPVGRPKAIVYLGGGGYVTGTPLDHPFVFSLLRRLESGYTIYAPAVRKSIDGSKAFPAPVLDTLAAYIHVRKTHEAEDITVMGDSAGGGLAWSLAAYLTILKELPPRTASPDPGIPGQLMLISPWLALPPVVESKYPDLVDTPQLLNAARCYMAAYPLLPLRPDPFSSEWQIWKTALQQTFDRSVRPLRQVFSDDWLPRLPFSRTPRHSKILVHDKTATCPKASTFAAQLDLRPFDQVLDQVLDQLPEQDLSLAEWIDVKTFQTLTSHHPLVSPSTNLSSPFVTKILSALSREKVRMMIHAGTAEWFFTPSMAFVNAAKKSGLSVTVQKETGGLHVQGCVLPAELGGSADRLVEGILSWIDT